MGAKQQKRKGVKNRSFLRLDTRHTLFFSSLCCFCLSCAHQCTFAHQSTLRCEPIYIHGHLRTNTLLRTNTHSAVLLWYSWVPAAAVASSPLLSLLFSSLCFFYFLCFFSLSSLSLSSLSPSLSLQWWQLDNNVWTLKLKKEKEEKKTKRRERQKKRTLAPSIKERRELSVFSRRCVFSIRVI